MHKVHENAPVFSSIAKSLPQISSGAPSAAW